MPDYAFLLHTEKKRPLQRRQGAEELGCAADVPPLGWLALFTAADIATLGKGDKARLTLFASVEAARKNLARRREVLEEVFAPPVARFLQVLDGLLERLPRGSRVQMWLGDLIFPWPASSRKVLEKCLATLDGRDHAAWRDLLSEVQAGIEPGSLKGQFLSGVAVNACAGWLEGQSCPSADMER